MILSHGKKFVSKRNKAIIDQFCRLFINYRTNLAPPFKNEEYFIHMKKSDIISLRMNKRDAEFSDLMINKRTHDFIKSN